MKKVYLLIAIAWLMSISVDAQYRYNKNKYNYHTYSYQQGDTYEPGAAGFTSFLIPGLGQMICGEVGRGLCFLGAYAGSWAGSFYGFFVFATAWPVSEWDTFNFEQALAGIGIMFVGAGCIIFVDIWSVVDAVHVAKVNNLARRDQRNTSFDLRLSPYIGSPDCFKLSDHIPVGLTLSLTF